MLSGWVLQCLCHGIYTHNTDLTRDHCCFIIIKIK